MKALPFAVIATVSLSLAACRTDPYMALMERENRVQQDKVYQLQDTVEDCRLRLEMAEQESADLRKRLQAGDSATAAGGPPFSSLGSDRDDAESRGPDFPGDFGAMAPPVVDMPAESLPPGEVPESLSSPRSSPEPEGPAVPETFQPPGSPGMSEAPDFREQREPADPSDVLQPPELLPAPQGSATETGDAQVVTLSLDRLLTGGYDADGRPGDDGIRVVLDPRDASGQTVISGAAISAIVFDEAKLSDATADEAAARDAAQVARWNLTVAETATQFGRSNLPSGLQLDLPWPGDPPSQGALYLYIRYTTADGRELIAHQPVYVTPPDERSSGWMQRPPEPPPPRTRAAVPRPSLPVRRAPVVQATHTVPVSETPAERKPPGPAWSPDRP